MLKIISVFGTRPEAIKMAPVVKELEKYPNIVQSRVLVTAQHREMLDQVLDLFEIVPDIDFNVMQENQSPTRVFSTIMARMEPALKKEQPDWVLVQGDTTTAAAVSMAAFYARAKLGHVEAGLRTHDKWQPFPEEINRRIAGVVADLHFAPTSGARENLLAEGIPDSKILITGNPVVDALHQVAAMPFDRREFNLPLNSSRTILVTVHRRENFGEPLQEICLALRQIARKYGDKVHLVYPVHLNPNVREPVYKMLGSEPNISLLPPVDYLSLVNLMKFSFMVLTDSGGIQEEAPALGKPVLVLREVTERPEAVEAGTVKVIGTDRDRIIAETTKLMENDGVYQSMSRAVNPYGDGLAARRIVRAICGMTWTPFRPKINRGFMQPEDQIAAFEMEIVE